MRLHSCVAALWAAAIVQVTGKTRCDPARRWLNHEGVCLPLSSRCAPQEFESWAAAGGQAAWRYALRSNGRCAHASRIGHERECQLAALQLGLASGAAWERSATNATNATNAAGGSFTASAAALATVAGFCRLRPGDDGHRSPELALDPHRCTPDRLCLCRTAERIADRHCVRLTVCAEGWYQSAPPTATSDRACSALSRCRRRAPGTPLLQFESRAPRYTWTFEQRLSGRCDGAHPRVASYAECRRASHALGLDRNQRARLAFSARDGCMSFTADAGRRRLAPGLRRDAVMLMDIHPRLVTARAGGNANLACSAARQCLCRKRRFAISDRVCAAVSKCAKWQFEIRAPTPTSNRGCAAIATCTDAQFQTVAPTLTSDRRCGAASICAPNSFEFRPLTSTSDRVCRPLTVCNVTAGEVEARPPRRGWRYTTRSWGQCAGRERRVLTSAECTMAAARAAHDVLSPQLRVEFVTRFDLGGCYFMRRALGDRKARASSSPLRGGNDWMCSADRRLCICRSHRVVIGDRACDTKRGGRASGAAASASDMAKAGFAALNALLGDAGCGGKPCSSGISCELSVWSSWGECSRSCGGGKQERRRSVLVPPHRGGAPCGALAEAQSCGARPCALDCAHLALKAWSAWGSCSATCGGSGTRTRTRERVRARATLYGGKACPAVRQQAHCNPQCCAGTHKFLAAATAGTSACSVGCCLKCAPGKFAPDIGMIQCTACRPGRYQPRSGASVCRPCLPGQYRSAHGGESCNVCSPGRFASNGGGQACTLCPSGQWAGASGSRLCRACAPGTAGAAALAHEDEHSDAEALAGLVAARSRPCVECAPGRFQPRSAATTCLRCSAGQFQPGQGGTSCLACPTGSVPTARSDSCRSCAPGHFGLPTSGSGLVLHCNPCPRGRFVARHGAVGLDACTFCRAGRYVDTRGSAVCKQCPGWSKGVAGVGAKMRIGAGGLLHCLVCPDGKWQTADGIAQCAECEAGRHLHLVDGVGTCADCRALDSARRTGTRGKAGQHKCQPLPLDCLPSPWGAWSGCQNTDASRGRCRESRRGRQSRTRAPVPQGVDNTTGRCGLSQQSSCSQSWGGGTPCSSLRWSEERGCEMAPCPPTTTTAKPTTTAESSAIDSIYKHVDINIINAIDWGPQ